MPVPLHFIQVVGRATKPADGNWVNQRLLVACRAFAWSDAMRGLLKAVAGAGSKLPLPSAPAPRTFHTIGTRRVEEIRQVAEGGFGFIYIVRDVATSEIFAMKRILCQDRDRYSLAKREIQYLSELNPHPNLVNYMGSSVSASDDGRTKAVNILLEYCEGGHLLDSLDKYNGHMPESLIVSTMIDICQGLLHLHSRSTPVAHRDLKLENVLCCGGTWKLCDFGSCSTSTIDRDNRSRDALLKAQDEIERNTTLMYRAPEMVDMYKNFEISTKVDVWMLGCLLFSLAFYRHPFQDESSLAIANARYHIPKGRATRSPKIVDLVHWMLAMDPRDRPSVGDVLRCLSQIRESTPIPLPPAVVEAKSKHDWREREHERSENMIKQGLDVKRLREAEESRASTRPRRAKRGDGDGSKSRNSSDAAAAETSKSGSGARRQRQKESPPREECVDQRNIKSVAAPGSGPAAADTTCRRSRRRKGREDRSAASADPFANTADCAESPEAPPPPHPLKKQSPRDLQATLVDVPPLSAVWGGTAPSGAVASPPPPPIGSDAAGANWAVFDSISAFTVTPPLTSPPIPTAVRENDSALPQQLHDQNHHCGRQCSPDPFDLNSLAEVLESVSVSAASASPPFAATATTTTTGGPQAGVTDDLFTSSVQSIVSSFPFTSAVPTASHEAQPLLPNWQLDGDALSHTLSAAPPSYPTLTPSPSPPNCADPFLQPMAAHPPLQSGLYGITHPQLCDPRVYSFSSTSNNSSFFPTPSLSASPVWTPATSTPPQASPLPPAVPPQLSQQHECQALGYNDTTTPLPPAHTNPAGWPCAVGDRQAVTCGQTIPSSFPVAPHSANSSSSAQPAANQTGSPILAVDPLPPPPRSAKSGPLDLLDGLL